MVLCPKVGILLPLHTSPISAFKAPMNPQYTAQCPLGQYLAQASHPYGCLDMAPVNRQCKLMSITQVMRSLKRDDVDAPLMPLISPPPMTSPDPRLPNILETNR